MTRYKLILEYNGTDTVGWQVQDSGISVQGLLQDAIFKFCQQNVEVVGAGRTDAGVHALGAICHFDIEEEKEEEKEKRQDTVVKAINFYLREMDAPVVVLSAQQVSDEFHARYGAVRRNYKYIILNRGASAVLDKDRVWWIPRPLDIDAMRRAAAKFIGEHDWTSFRCSECQAKSPIKTLDKIEIFCNPHPSVPASGAVTPAPQNHPPQSAIASGPGGGRKNLAEYGVIEFSARSFMHNQVRNIVGTLVEIGLGKPLDIDEIFAAKNRAAAGPTAPACGLYFVSAIYD
jgi:tRNA pseudouridine38-40 synthase